MKSLIIYILLNYLIFGQGEQLNLTKIIHQHLQQGKPNIVLKNYDYYLDGSLVIENIREFTLKGNWQSVKCNESSTGQDGLSLKFSNISKVTIEGINFNNCNRNLSIQNQPQNNLGFITFHLCQAVNVSKCKFQNVSGINLLCVNTQNVSIMNSEFVSRDNGSSKGILVFSDHIEYQNYKVEVRRNVFEGKYWVVNYFNDQVPGVNSSVNCGSAVSVCYLKNTSLIEIEDNNFTSNHAAQGSSICVSIGEEHQYSRIKISKGNFKKGKLNKSRVEKLYKEMPAGGAVALFLKGGETDLTIIDCNFTNNHGPNGGAVYIYRESDGWSRIENCTFNHNKGESGGALMLTSTRLPQEVRIILKNSQFINNYGYVGGAILAHRVSLIIYGTVNVTGNNCKNGNGGGIALIYSELSVEGTLRIRNNSVGVDGAGVYMSSESDIWMDKKENSTLEIMGNNANIYGGGIYVYSLYYENTFLDWDSNIENIKAHCFLSGSKHAIIKILENKASDDNKVCAGNMIYTQLLGQCFDSKFIEGQLYFDNKTCSKDTREESFLIEMNITSFIECKQTLFSQAAKTNDNYMMKLSHFCKSSGNYNPLTKVTDVTSKMVTVFHKNNSDINKFYYIYPGNAIQINISSNDSFGNNVITRAILSGIVYSNGLKKEEPSQNIIYQGENPHRSFLTNISTNIIIKSSWKGLGIICVESFGDFYKKKTCIGIIVGNCPYGFTREHDKCTCSNGDGYSCYNNNIFIKQGYYIASEEDDITGLAQEVYGARCLWPRCKCVLGATNGECHFNPIAPDEQCRTGLSGMLCGKCTDTNKTMFLSPFFNNIKSYPYSNCIDCNPGLMIVLFFLFISVFCVIIMLFRINLFADYWRSIVIYANILYIILVNSNSLNSNFVNIMLSIPILPLNLLITQILPFCLYPGNKILYVVLFDMTVPLAVLCIFILLQRFLLSKVSWLSTRDVPTQIWSMLLLSYTDLSIHAFMILTCPQIKKRNYWLYDGQHICYQGLHLMATGISLFYLFALSSIPLFLLFITLNSKKDFQFHHNFTQEFKHKFRWWEIYKLFLRLVISFMLSFMTNFIDLNSVQITVSILCLLTMVINSLFKPANNRLSNHFESFCFLFLALTAVAQGPKLFHFFPIIPFIVGITAILLLEKIPLWRGKILKIKATWKKEAGVLGRLKLLFKIWDVKSKYELEVMYNSTFNHPPL
ncbi:hypothetical protein LOD99_12739 [Oopsacas minuta]|uniref:Right handed beta helix domain-containing protein n=1 Tax=Oopsacas minuta TaxID=111878 RepID=A0AAV7JCV5_9METZ|nr:hypothetical protein LOD99_12739 [Oopsacas minuta]